MIIIYPQDPTTDFLLRIITSITKLIDGVGQYDFHYTSVQENIITIKQSNPQSTIIYLGHGTASELNVNNGEESIISTYDAKKMFGGKKIILLSCYSSSFINSLNDQFEVAIGFGNILTSENELKGSDKEKYNYEEFKCIYEFRSSLVTIFKNSIIEAAQFNYTFQQLFNCLKLHINKKISKCSLSQSKTDYLVGELMFKLKSEMILRGNSKAYLISK